jgi:hypothetical protein
MKWLLVAIVMNVPVKTDLVFNSLSDCLAAELKMRGYWADIYNRTLKNNASKESLELVRGQKMSGTCIPTK